MNLSEQFVNRLNILTSSKRAFSLTLPISLLLFCWLIEYDNGREDCSLGTKLKRFHELVELRKKPTMVVWTIIERFLDLLPSLFPRELTTIASPLSYVIIIAATATTTTTCWPINDIETNFLSRFGSLRELILHPSGPSAMKCLCVCVQ